MITHQDSIELAARLQLPEIAQRVVRGEKLENNVDIIFRAPLEFYIMDEDQQLSYGQGKIIPLWDDGNFDEIAGYHIEAERYVRFYVEEDVDAESVPTYSWQRVLLPHFERLFDLFDGNMEKLKDLAAQFQFDYLEQLVYA